MFEFRNCSDSMTLSCFLFTGSGYIEYDEFEQLMKVQLEKYDKKKAMCMNNFKKYDKDNSGAIDFNELKMVLMKSDWTISETEIQEHFDKADKNGDGKIAFNGKYYVLLE